MDYTKILGGLCGALLVLMLVGWASETIYHVGPSGHGDGHGDDDGHGGSKHAYVIEVEEVEVADAAEDAGPTIEELLASADVAKGESVFKKCKSCHELEDGKNKNGPHLFNVVDRTIAGVGGFDYSGTLAGLGGNWGINELDGFLANPKAYAPGTKMSFAGLKKGTDRANLIAYLQTIQ